MIADLMILLNKDHVVQTLQWANSDKSFDFAKDPQFPNHVLSQCSGTNGSFLAYGKTYFYQWIDQDNGTRLFLMKEKDSSVTLLEKALDQMSDGVQIYDRETRLQYINRTSKTISGFHEPTENLCGKKLMELYHVTDDSSTVLTTLRTQRPVVNRFARFLSSTGKTVVTCNTGIPLYNDQGDFIGAVDFEQDVHALEKRREQNEKIRLSMQQVITTGLYAKDPTSYTFEDFIGHNQKIKEVVELAQAVSAKESNILILGETGTGKEIFAQSIHHDSLRSKHKFIAINCAAIPEQLAESILFGTEKGSFTGSVQKRGLFEEADQGTIFLDELNSMGLGLQSKLLRVLQEGVFRRMGGNRDLHSDVRIIASCNENIFQLVEENKLRRDLFYRIATVIIDLPPLRNHLDDLEDLTWHHIRHSNSDGVPKFTGVHPEVFRIFRQYTWPGNVRELNHVLDYAETIAEGDTLIRDYLPSYLLQAIDGSQPIPFFTSETGDGGDFALTCDGTLSELLNQYETIIIQQALIKHNGNITQAAKSLGIQRQNLQYRLKKLKSKN